MLLIDVDGVLSLFGFEPSAPPPGRLALVDGLPHFFSSTAGALLAGLNDDFELTWCTGWEERAGEHLPLALGVPAGLGHLSFGPPAPAAAAAGTSGARHWKLDAIDRHAGPHRPLAWIDDGFDAGCHAWAADRPGPTLLVATDPAIGLTAAHAERLRAWSRGLSAPDRYVEGEAPCLPAPAWKRSMPA
ncbi:MAG: hypothetical protein ACRDMJ_07200 [Solirubrobacteraceae bacterium]